MALTIELAYRQHSKCANEQDVKAARHSDTEATPLKILRVYPSDYRIKRSGTWIQYRRGQGPRNPRGRDVHQNIDQRQSTLKRRKLLIQDGTDEIDGKGQSKADEHSCRSDQGEPG